MIIELTVKLIDGAYATDDWIGVFEMDELSTLRQLHCAINDTIDFDSDHMFEFYAAREPFSRQNRISLAMQTFENSVAGNGLALSLSQVFPLGKYHKLFYLFDFGDQWVFSIGKGRKKAQNPVVGTEYTRLCNETGTRPTQYPYCNDE